MSLDDLPIEMLAVVHNFGACKGGEPESLSDLLEPILTRRGWLSLAGSGEGLTSVDSTGWLLLEEACSSNPLAGDGVEPLELGKGNCNPPAREPLR